MEEPEITQVEETVEETDVRLLEEEKLAEPTEEGVE